MCLEYVHFVGTEIEEADVCRRQVQSDLEVDRNLEMLLALAVLEGLAEEDGADLRAAISRRNQQTRFAGD